jgi:hypothetical protein
LYPSFFLFAAESLKSKPEKQALTSDHCSGNFTAGRLGGVILGD